LVISNTLTPDPMSAADDTYPMAPEFTLTKAMISSSDPFSGGGTPRPEKI
jgi:hypothetical protein